MKRIALFGFFGIGNLGNEGSLEAVHAVLRTAAPTAEIVCICADPDVVRATHGIAAQPISSPRKGGSGFLGKWRNLAYAVQEARRFDLILVPGTGILDDFGMGPFGMPYAVFRWTLAARLAGVPFAFVSIGAGPVVHPLSRILVRAAAWLAASRTYRDQNSKDFLESIGFRTGDDRVLPDVAFLLPPPPASDTVEASSTVGVGLMSYYGWRCDPESGSAIYSRYIGQMIDFCEWLLRQGRRIRFLIGEDSDLQAVSDVQSALQERCGDLSGRIDLEQPHSLGDLMRQIGQTDAVVATRFHNIVCALKVGKPTISIGYAAKNDVLMQQAGLGEYCQQLEQLDPARLQEQFLALWADRRRAAAQASSFAQTARQVLDVELVSLIRGLTEDDRRAAAAAPGLSQARG
ncbi:dTDP-4-dehydrorhamnose 3,5-epimerase [Alsobacter soli]|uniref:dTDP-4-dehydrorhamnose 3,5-epimerase n=1 Tax=Alsobacter soli TaxID=2109933 RepID=A0A2T1HQR7_9HYPH|nr:polysaccharide pyruvyl transferase family protein [Alsobacter soli]PSC03991.1 dTDP-4-dehydrorhamnose 3,5-epimerase [Alsobacter soli]